MFIFPGATKREHLRAATHLYSTLEGKDIPRRLVFGYTGWRRIDDRWHYLTGSGALTRDGLVQSHEVDTGQGHMARYRLPSPPDHSQIKAASGLIVELLEICPDKPHVGATLLATIARAPLAECLPIDFVLYFYGLTGTRKSSIAGVVQAFFGDFAALTLPANWTDSTADLEAKSFAAKDACFTVDDFKPAISSAEAARLHAKLENFVRNTGNQQGRGRRKSDMTSRAPLYNRSMSIVTAEDLPKGQSLLGRCLLIELGQADVAIDTLTRLQQAADAGTLSGLMAGYIQWLAGRMDEMKVRYGKAVIQFRDQAGKHWPSMSHSRTLGNFAQLVAAGEVFLEFMHNVGALTGEQVETLSREIKLELGIVSAEQAQYQQEQDEITHFFDLLRAVLSGGNGHIADRLTQGVPATRPHAWGWRSESVDLSGGKVYRPMGDCLGWYAQQTDPEVWLEKNTVYAAVQKLARAQDNSFLLSASMLWRRMDQRGLLLSVETEQGGRRRTDVKRMVAGRKRRVLVLPADWVESGEKNK